MRFGNPALQKIYDNVVAPTINNIHHTTSAYIYGVDRNKQTVDVVYKEPGGGSRQMENVPIPRQADGIFKQDIEIGDRAMIAFRGNDLGSPYITVIYKNNPSDNDYLSKYGGGIPKGIGYF